MSVNEVFFFEILGMARFAHVLPTAKLLSRQGYPEILGPVREEAGALLLPVPTQLQGQPGFLATPRQTLLRSLPGIAITSHPLRGV